MKYFQLSFILLASFFFTTVATAQVGINEDNSSPDASAMLDVKSTSKGVLIPRMSTIERTNIALPVEGLLVYDNETFSFWYYTNSAWKELGADSADNDATNEYNTSVVLNGTNLETTDGGGTITTDLSSLQDGVDDADNDPTNEHNTSVVLNGTNLETTDGGGTITTDLSSLQDGVDDADNDPTNEHNTSVVLNGTNLETTDGGGTITTDLSSLQDGVDDADNDPTNEHNTSVVLNGTNLETTDGGGTITTDLSSLQDGVDDADNDPTNEHNTSVVLNGTNLETTDGGGTITTDLSSVRDAHWEVSSGTNIYNANDGNVGIGDMAATQNRWALTVKETGNAMISTLDSIDVSELAAAFIRNINENNVGIGIGFQSTSTVNGMGAAIVHERTNSNSRGKLHFATKSSGSAADEDLPIRMTIDETGNLGIGVTAPSAKLHVSDGDIYAEDNIGIGEPSPQASLDVVDEAVIGNMTVGDESTDQGTSSFTGTGFTATPWLYTNAVEAQGERGTNSTLITLGADGTYSTAGDYINFVTSGNAQMTIASDGRIGVDEQDPEADIHIVQSQQSITNGLGGVRYEVSNDNTDWWRTYHSGIYFSFNLQGNRVAYVNTNGTWTVDSDLTLKKNISNLSSTLDRVMQLRPVKYHYKEQPNSAAKTIGFIAQEAQPLFPEMVVKGEDGKLGMTYSYAGVIAIKAIQEQQETIGQQEQKIQQLEKQNNDILQRMTELEELLRSISK